MNSMETTKLHNYKSLNEEFFDSDYYSLSRSKYSTTDDDDNLHTCFCCKIEQNNSPKIIRRGSYNGQQQHLGLNNNGKMPIYDNIWLGEQRNATDYIEYLNRIRRNSLPANNFYYNNNNNNINNFKQANYYQISVTDFSVPSQDTNEMKNNTSNNIHKSNSNNNFLKVPKFFDEELRKTPEFDDIANKINEINQLDTSVSSLIYKSIEVHADILSLDATVSRLLAETRQILDELEDVKCLDDIIDMLNKDVGPVIHKEWRYPISDSNLPVEEGIPVA